MPYRPWTTTLAAALLLANAACTVDDAAAKNGAAQALQAPAITVLSVTANDFSFDAPATVPAGLTTVRLASQGREMHHAQLVRLAEGKTAEDFRQALAAGGAHGGLPAWATFVGGPNVPAPNGTTEATMELEPGNYALVCVIPSPDGVPHLMKGMIKPLTVVPAPSTVRVRPEVADTRMVLRDYAYEITPELTAGRRTIRVENAAEQPHEVVLMRLNPGRTLQDMMGWLATQAGPPPGMPVAGTTMLSTGEVNQITAELEPGEYALLCLVPDAKDGAPHIAHGMARQVTVR
jgi:hypothetical protein